MLTKHICVLIHIRTKSETGIDLVIMADGSKVVLLL